ncbi:hypothetical protein BJV78DRAFT_1156187 [Lactifluus subvellereus]|nr:hypothetical protein BJV78DRAFT_1156187 [Lactifluus subvellereus]
MFFPRYPSYLPLILAATLLPLAAHGYFLVTSPTKGVEWVNGQTYPITWTKGLLDGIAQFDLELTRMSTEGLIFVARDISSSIGGINIALNGVPAGNDYFLLLLNSTHGGLYANSQVFSITNSGSGNSTARLASKPTVTISGGPNPTAQFATTFAQVNGVNAWRPTPTALLSAVLMAFALLAGAAAAL